MTNPKVNTDRTLFEKDGNRVFVTEHGSLGIESHGHVIVRPIESWHEAAIQQFDLQKSAEEISTEWKSKIESAIADSAKSLARVEDEVRRLNELYSILSQTYTER